MSMRLTSICAARPFPQWPTCQHWPAQYWLRQEGAYYDQLFAAYRTADDPIECRLSAALDQLHQRLLQLIDLVTDQIGERVT